VVFSLMDTSTQLAYDWLKEKGTEIPYAIFRAKMKEYAYTKENLNCKKRKSKYTRYSHRRAIAYVNSL
jgi:hypothetical protein